MARCIKEVAAKGGVKSPGAVCAASMRGKYAKNAGYGSRRKSKKVMKGMMGDYFSYKVPKGLARYEDKKEKREMKRFIGGIGRRKR